MNTPVILGIDPGKSGAIAALTLDGDLLWVEDRTPLTGAAIGTWLAERLHGENVVTCWVERVHAMPKQGVTSVWTFGEGYGALLGALGALAIRVEHVTPGVWKRAAGLNADKTASRQRASERWPADAPLFKRVKDDGRAEACLIAEYGRLQVGR